MSSTEKNQQVVWSNFVITVLPEPPTGINEGTLPPDPELVESIPISTYYYDTWKSSDTDLTLVAVEQASISYCSSFPDPISVESCLLGNVTASLALTGEIDEAFTMTTPEGEEVIAKSLPYHVVEESIANTLAGLPTEVSDAFCSSLHPVEYSLEAIFGWEQISSQYIQGGSTELEISVTEGTTSTDQECYSFAESIGASVTAGFDGLFASLSSTLSGEFSASQEITHSISVTQEKTVTYKWQIPADHFYQLWQLHVRFVSSDGTFIRQNINIYQLLTYPHEGAEQVLRLPHDFNGEVTPENLMNYIKKKYNLD